jgi:hypothetical protein
MAYFFISLSCVYLWKSMNKEYYQSVNKINHKSV